MNYKASTLTDHQKSKQHRLSLKLQEMFGAEKADLTRICQHINQPAPENSAIKQRLCKKSENKRYSLKRLFNVMYITAKRDVLHKFF